MCLKCPEIRSRDEGVEGFVGFSSCLKGVRFRIACPTWFLVDLLGLSSSGESHCSSARAWKFIA